jgi:hypothetical protein
MAEPGDRLGLSAEAGELSGVVPAASADHLHRHQAIQTHMEGLMDHAHATFAQFLHEDIAWDLHSHGGGHLEADSR